MTLNWPLLSQFIMVEVAVFPDTPFGLFLYVPETAYQRHSPELSFRASTPSVFQGSLPMTLTSEAPQGEAAWPSYRADPRSGQGR